MHVQMCVHLCVWLNLPHTVRICCDCGLGGHIIFLGVVPSSCERFFAMAVNSLMIDRFGRLTPGHSAFSPLMLYSETCFV